MVMEIIDIPPTAPPAMTPTWTPECEGVGGAVRDALEEGLPKEDMLAENVLVMDALAEDVLVVGALAVDVDTPEDPRIAPGPYSGVSISNMV